MKSHLFLKNLSKQTHQSMSQQPILLKMLKMNKLCRIQVLPTRQCRSYLELLWRSLAALHFGSLVNVKQEINKHKKRYSIKSTSFFQFDSFQSPATGSYAS